jgi:tetratricopeptide (TPR) repeat protein
VRQYRYEGAVIDARFFVNRGDCYRILDRLPLALADYHSAHELIPTCWDVITRLSLVRHSFGIQLFNQGKFLEAEVEFSAAIKHNPKVATYYAHRGNALYYQMSFAYAYKDYIKALELDPNMTEVKARLAQFKSQETLAHDVKLQSNNLQGSRKLTKPSSMLSNAEIAHEKYLGTHKKVRDMYVDRPRIDEPKTLDPQKSKKENEGSWQNVSDEA